MIVAGIITNKCWITKIKYSDKIFVIVQEAAGVNDSIQKEKLN